MRVANPYSAGGMVTDPATFFGRGEELRRIRDRLRKGDSTAVVGLRRIGKSSLLYRLASEPHLVQDGTVLAYLDLQEATHHEPLGLLNGALQTLDGNLNGRFRFESVTGLAGFTAQIKKMAAAGYHPALCLDEMEELTDRPAFDDDRFEGLRSLGQQRLLAYVTASGKPLDILLRQGKRTSPFYNLFLNLELAGLSDKGARALLREPFERAGLSTPQEEQVAYVLELAGHYPFYMQMAAYHLFELKRKNSALDRLALQEAFTRDAERHFRGLWRELSIEEQRTANRVAHMPATATGKETRYTDLVRNGLIEQHRDGIRLFSKAFADMVRAGKLEQEYLTISHTKPAKPSICQILLLISISVAIVTMTGAILSSSALLFGITAITSLIAIFLGWLTQHKGE